MRKKIILLTLLFLLAFGYGFSVGFYNIFPFNQALSVKHYLQHTFGQFESQTTRDSVAVDIYNTALNRLLIKKVQIPSYTGGGGGILNIDNILYIISNKGSILAYNLNSFSKLITYTDDVPMNFGELIQSGHPYINDFRIPWFRVNGVYGEVQNNNRHILFVSHNSYNEEKDCITHNVSRIELKADSNKVNQIDSWNTIFTASPCIDPVPDKWYSAAPYSGHISGGKIAEYDEDRLLITVGDYNKHGINEVDEYAMDPSNPYGKFLLLDKKTGSWSVFAMGSRNPSGLYIDREGTIWSSENGPEGGDELNIIEEGKNYGWPRESYGLWYDHIYSLPGESKRGTHNNYTKPVFSWIPSIAPSNLIKIEGNKFEYWKGDLLLGTMRDQSLRRLRVDDNNQVVYDERIHIGHRIRDITTLPSDKIVLITDDGFLIVIDDGGPIFQEKNAETIQNMEALNNFDRFKSSTEKSDTELYKNSSKAIYQQNCATCHNLDRSNQIGPHLYNLFNRKVGELDNFNYSRTLKEDTRNWNTQLLRSFLENPNNKFSGTSMPEVNLSASEVDSVIQFLKTRGTDD